MPNKETKGEPLIRSLELISSASLADMHAFYHKLLGLGAAEQKPDRLTVEAGRTRLTFVNAPAGGEKPFYHFAFNIPENKAIAARDWQAKRTPLLPIPQALRDPKYPDDVVHYRHWNAHSVFFFDPAGNVVEYIARHDLNNPAPGDFGVADILYASEIAFVVDDVAAATRALKEAVGLGEYTGASEQFAALGDEHGLLLVMKRGRLISFEAKENKEVGVFPTVATVRGTRPSRYALPKFPYQVSVEC
jgi:catechol-2,3-dioxygenase